MKNYYYIILLLVCLIGACQNSNKYEPTKYLSGKEVSIKTTEDILDKKEVIEDIIKNKCSFNYSLYMESDLNGNLYVAINRAQIIKFNTEEKIEWVYSNKGNGPGELLHCKTIKINGTNIFILDDQNNKIVNIDNMGNFKKDIVLDGMIMDFDVLNDKIYVPIPVNKMKQNPIAIYSFEGKKIDEIGTGIDESDYVSEIPYDPLIYICPNKNILLVMAIQGSMYLFNSEGKLLQRFTIQNGEEWDADLEFEKKHSSKYGKSFPRRITKVEFDSSNNIYVNYGGKTISKKQSILMMYNSAGEFITRILDDGCIKQRPLTFALNGDGSLYIHTNSGKIFKARL